MSGKRYTDYELKGIINSRMVIIDDLLFYGGRSRKFLSQSLGISTGSVTNHTQDLIKMHLLQSVSRELQGANRPTETLNINGGYGICGSAAVYGDRLEAEILQADGKVVSSRRFSHQPRQCEVLASISECMDWFSGFPEARSILFGIDGVISSYHNIVFKINGISEWEPCPAFTLQESSSHFSNIRCCTRVIAIARGYARSLQHRDAVGIYNLEKHNLQIAAVYADANLPVIGNLGTASVTPHFETPSGLPCFCGRSHCFYAGVKAGKIPEKELIAGLEIMNDHMHLKKCALFSPDAPVLRHHLPDSILFETDSRTYYQSGLRMTAVYEFIKSSLTQVYQSNQKSQQ